MESRYLDLNQVENGRPSPFEPVAIIGMAMRLPGRVRTSEDFWKLLAEKKSGMCKVPKDRFNIDGFHHPLGKAGTIPQDKAYFLDDVQLHDFDPSAFSISSKELERLDPAQRQLLQVAYECMEDAGVSSWKGSKVGCFVGTYCEDWHDINAKESQHRGGYRGTGWGDFALGNRVSYEFDLHGPSMTVKTACSSSLVCLDMACEAIRNGECEGSLVGGTSLMFSPTAWMTLHDQGLLSPTGECRTFDAAANGYARGEAINMIYIKKLSSAVRDGDNIRAIIRGTAVNCDGRTQGMTMPSSRAQAELIRRTYEVAGIRNLSETAFVECHGTGTPVGDPLEVDAVASCFGDEGVVITGVKPNVGHAEGAAGITSLMKAVLALEHNQVPPNINFGKPNPKSKQSVLCSKSQFQLTELVPFEARKLHVPVDVEAWPQGRAERVILESPRQFGIADSASADKAEINGNGNGTVHSGVTQNGVHNKYVNRFDHKYTNGADHNYANGVDHKKINGVSHKHLNGFHNGSPTKSINGGNTYTNGHTKETINGDNTYINGNTKETINGGNAYTNGHTKETINGNGVVPATDEPSLLLISAYSAVSIDQQVDALREHVHERDVDLRDLAYTLGNKREQMPHRAYVVTSDTSKMQTSPTQLVQSQSSPRVAWVFTGQGAQWPEMGAELIELHPVFRDSIRRMDRFLQALSPPPSWTIEGMRQLLDIDW
ncbi:MAG: hypothetical protein Q9165_007263 [Trypethelium subeluteriae]